MSGGEGGAGGSRGRGGGGGATPTPKEHSNSGLGIIPFPVAPPLALPLAPPLPVHRPLRASLYAASLSVSTFRPRLQELQRQKEKRLISSAPQQSTAESPESRDRGSIGRASRDTALRPEDESNGPPSPASVALSISSAISRDSGVALGSTSVAHESPSKPDGSDWAQRSEDSTATPSSGIGASPRRPNPSNWGQYDTIPAQRRDTAPEPVEKPVPEVTRDADRAGAERASTGAPGAASGDTCGPAPVLETGASKAEAAPEVDPVDLSPEERKRRARERGRQKELERQQQRERLRQQWLEEDEALQRQIDQQRRQLLEEQQRLYHDRLGPGPEGARDGGGGVSERLLQEPAGVDSDESPTLSGARRLRADSGTVTNWQGFDRDSAGDWRRPQPDDSRYDAGDAPPSGASVSYRTPEPREFHAETWRGEMRANIEAADAPGLQQPLRRRRQQPVGDREVVVEPPMAEANQREGVVQRDGGPSAGDALELDRAESWRRLQSASGAEAVEAAVPLALIESGGDARLRDSPRGEGAGEGLRKGRGYASRPPGVAVDAHADADAEPRPCAPGDPGDDDLRNRSPVGTVRQLRKSSVSAAGLAQGPTPVAARESAPADNGLSGPSSSVPLLSHRPEEVPQDRAYGAPSPEPVLPRGPAESARSHSPSAPLGATAAHPQTTTLRHPPASYSQGTIPASATAPVNTTPPFPGTASPYSTMPPRSTSPAPDAAPPPATFPSHSTTPPPASTPPVPPHATIPAHASLPPQTAVLYAQAASHPSIGGSAAMVGTSSAGSTISQSNSVGPQSTDSLGTAGPGKRKYQFCGECGYRCGDMDRFCEECGEPLPPD